MQILCCDSTKARASGRLRLKTTRATVSSMSRIYATNLDTVTIAEMLAQHGSVFMRRLQTGSWQICVQIGGALYRNDPHHGLAWLRNVVRVGRITKGKYPVWIANSAQARDFLEAIRPQFFATTEPRRAAMKNKIDNVLYADSICTKPRRARDTYE